MSRWVWGLISGAMLGLACAQPEAATQRARPALAGTELPLVIDLEPRCASIGSDISLGPAVEAPDGAGRLTRRVVRDGIEGWSIETPYAARDSLSWGFPAGRRIDPAHLELAAALLRTGGTTTDPVDFRNRVSRMSGSLEVHVKEEWIWLELSFPAPELATALDVLMEWRKPGAIEPVFFEAARRSFNLTSLAAELDASRIAERAFARFQPSENLKAPRTDTEEDPTPESFERLLDVSLDPTGSVLLHTRSSESSPAAEMIGAAFARLEVPTARTASSKRPAKPARRASDLLLPTPDTLYVVDRPGAPQVEILVGYPTVAPRHSDTPALEMLASLLGGDVGGRLFRDLRERHGLAYIINAAQSPGARFVVSTRARPERVARLVQGIEDHLEALVVMPFEPCEIATIEARMRGEELIARDEVGQLRERFRKDIAYLGVPTNSDDRIASYTTAAREGLVGVAREYLAGEAIVILVGDAERLERDFESAVPAGRVRVFEADLRSLR